MNVTQIFSCLFAIISAAHVTFIFLKKEKLRRISKILVMPPLLGVYVSGAANLFSLPVAALVLGWIGDILLIRITKRTNFMLGLLSFLLGHVCYAAAFTATTGGINIPAALVSVPVAGLLGVLSFRLVRPHRPMLIPVVAYTVVIVAMSLCAFQLMLFRADFQGYLIFAGCVCFIISDTILGHFTFKKLKLWGAVLIMVFYILAQAGIIYGFLGF